MIRMNKKGVIASECASLSPEVINGRVICSTWISYDEISAEDICSDNFEGIEMRFALADIVSDVLIGNSYRDGTIDLDAKQKLTAIRSELEEMIRRIDGVEYSAPHAGTPI